MDWAGKIDPMCCISMHGVTERYIPGQKADAAGFVRILLDDLESRISMQFSRVSYCIPRSYVLQLIRDKIFSVFSTFLQFVDETCHQIERNERNVRQMGVLSFIPR